ncbi:MAG: hypothetical protein IKG92_09445, partial [Bacteroidales bacterium]|nr:hypothetical protein [Bacteroidales bacterium]
FVVCMRFDNNTIWNEAARAGLLFGAVSVACLGLKELSALSGSAFLVQAAAIILWVVEFFGCILIMKNIMLRFRDKYEGVKMEDTYKLGRRAGFLSGLILASAQAFIIMKMPAETMDEFVNQMMSTAQLLPTDRDAVDAALANLPVLTFIFQWLYCYLYGSILASVMSRYIFLQKLFGGGFPPKEDDNNPEQQ